MGTVRPAERPGRTAQHLRRPGSKHSSPKLKAELYRLKKELKDDDQFADNLPPDGVDGPFPDKKLIVPATR